MRSMRSNPEFGMLLSLNGSENDLDNFISDHKIDWEYLIELANQQGMLSLLHLGLKEVKREEIPTKVTDYLKAIYYENTKRNLLLLSKLIQLLQLLDAAGINAVPFKGVLLSKNLYDSYTLRHAGDIDILVKPEDVPKFVDILLGQGYDLEYPFSRNQQIALARISREKRINMIDREKRLAIEIHWRVFSRELIGKTETDFIWGNLEDTTIQHTETKTFKAEVMLLYLCFHAYKHNWQRLFWLWEIDQFIKKNQDLNWNWILNHSQNFGDKNVLFLSLLVVNGAFGTEIPKVIQDQITGNQHVHQLFSQIQIEPERFEFAVERSIDFLSLRNMFTIKSRIVGRIAQFLRFAFTPNHFDILAFDFHPTLHFLYFLLRPFRLLFTAARQLFMPSK